MRPATLSATRRATDLRRLADERLDVLVVGGGITGAGATLDAVTRGLSVGVVEAQDWAAGTSSRSSKLIHGGLRYLQMLDFGLVRQALGERGLLLRELAPHLVRPIPILYPLKRAVVERAYVGAGVALYDALAWSSGAARGLPLHRHLSRRTTLELAPALRHDRLAGALLYYDAQVDDARYVLEVVRTAVSFGAVAVSRAGVVGILRDGERVVGARVLDAESGEQFDVRARATVLATGPWSEDTEALAGLPRSVRVRPSKGVHLLVPRARIDSSSALILRTEKSVLFVLPWGDHWLIGTTDTDWEHDKARPVATASDVAYLLGHLNEVLDDPLTQKDVEGAIAGLRPLVAGIGVVRGPGESAGRPAEQRAAHDEPASTRVSREHAVARPAPGLVVVSGGKYTTYRVMAADAIDAAVAELGTSAGPSRTASVPLLGAAGFAGLRARSRHLANRYGLEVADVEHLVDRYGGLADEVLELVEADRSLAGHVPGGGRHLRAELAYAVTHEDARHLEDVLWRRTRIAMSVPGLQLASAAACETIAPLLGWDERTAARELEDVGRQVALEAAAAGADDDEAAMRLIAATPHALAQP